jgi:TonB family protein
MMIRRAIIVLAGIAVLASSPLALAQTGGNETPTHQPKLTKAPKLVKFVEAPYPESEKAAGRMASVILQIAISETGAVQEVVVVQSAGPAFDAAAVEAVKQFVFEPAEIDEKPAPVKLTYKYDFVLKEEPKGPIVNFEGIVRDRFSKKPLANVKITVDGVGETTTDDEGHFQFEDVAPGKYTVTVVGDGLTPVTTEETIEEKKKTEVKYAVEPKEDVPADEASDVEVVVVAPKIQKEVVTTEIKVEEGKRVPGTQGDTLKVVQNLPGVARASFGSGALVVWGAAPQDTRVYVDGVHIPLLYHGGGIRSTINSDIVRAIELSPGGYGAEYGRGLGGLVTVDTRAPRADKWHGYVAADVIDASGMVETPIDGKTRVAVAVRKSYLDRTLKLATSEDVGDFVPIPSYWDSQLKIVRDLGPNETVELFVLGSSDSLTRSVTDPDPAQTKSEDSINSFSRFIVKYQRQLADGSTVFVTPSFGHDRSQSISRFGGTPAVLDTSDVAYGFRAGWRGRVAPAITVAAGIDFEGTSSSITRQGSPTLPAREGDLRVFGQAPPDQVNYDDWSTTIATIAPYGQADVSLLDDKLHIVPGVRIEPYLTGGSRQTPVKGETPSIGFLHQDTAVDPRVSIRYQPIPKVGFKAAFGIYHQSPQPEDLSAVFGNPSLGISKATHWLAGTSYKMTDELSIEAVGFYSHSTDLVSRSEAATPLLAQALVNEEEGRAYGAQVLVRRELVNGFFGWASYSIIRAERKDHPDTDWRLFDYDQTHVATLVASYELGKGWEVGGRFRYATGFPRTPVLGAYFGARRDLYEPYFGKQNSFRLPAFVQADARLAKRFEFAWGKAEAYLDVQNVTNRQNPEEIYYNYNYTQHKYIYGLPILPVFGGRMEW